MDLLEGGGRSSHNMSVAPSGLERVEGAHNQGGSLVEKYIHRENLSLFKKRLAEPHTDAEREVLMKLLADEQAKEPPPKNGVLKPR